MTVAQVLVAGSVRQMCFEVAASFLEQEAKRERAKGWSEWVYANKVFPLEFAASLLRKRAVE